MFSHQKQIGTNQGGIGFGSGTADAAPRLRSERFELDEDGFQRIKRR